MVEHDTFNDSAYHYMKHSGHKGNNFIANTNHGLHLKSKKVLRGPETKSCAKKRLHDLTIFIKRNSVADMRE